MATATPDTTRTPEGNLSSEINGCERFEYDFTGVGNTDTWTSPFATAPVRYAISDADQPVKALYGSGAFLFTNAATSAFTLIVWKKK